MVTLCVLRTLTGPKAYLDHLVVAPDWRRRGIGRALVRHAIEEARAAGAGGIDLTARDEKQAGRALYKSLGFQERDTGSFRYSSSPSAHWPSRTEPGIHGCRAPPFGFEPFVNPAGAAQYLPREHRRRRAAAQRWLQLRSGALRGARAARRSPLLPLSKMPAPDWHGSVDQGARRACVGPHRSRSRVAARVEARGRPREVVLRRMWLGAVQQHDGFRRSPRHPHGRLRHRSGDPPQRPVLRCLRRPVGADPRRASPLRCQAP